MTPLSRLSYREQAAMLARRFAVESLYPDPSELYTDIYD